MTAILMLGRAGDILNALPVAYHISQATGERPDFMVAKDYISILDGVSYVNPMPFFGPFEDIKRAYSQLEGKYERILVPQVYGRDWECPKQHDSFCRDGWENCGLIDLFGKVPLVFDKRDASREKQLIQKYIRRDTILLNFSGKSSPFPEGDVIRRELELSWGLICNIVDLSKIKAWRIYDLLGLYDNSSLLLTSDTATLHLAQASNIPSIQFIVDRPTMWHGSTPKGNVKFSCRYGEARFRMNEINATIAKSIGNDNPVRIAHVYSSFQGGGRDQARNRFARTTWQHNYQQGGWASFPTPDESLGRLFDCDGKKLPYLKDIIDAGLHSPNEEDWILLTNTDTCFAKNLHTRLQSCMNDRRMVFSARKDFPILTTLLTEEQISRGNHYPGADLFFFPKSWWKKVRESFPDVLIGREGWDACLRELMIKEGAEPLENSIYHQSHQSLWEIGRYTSKSQVHNRVESARYLRSLGLDPVPFGL